MTSRKNKYLIRKFWKYTFSSFLIVTLAIGTTLFYVFQIEPNWIEIKRINVTLPHLNYQFNDWKIVQISDIHVNSWMNKKRLNKVVKLVNQQNPEIITITGDFINKDIPHFDNLFVNFVNKYVPFVSIKNTNKRMTQEDYKIAAIKNLEQILVPSLSQLKPQYKTFAVLGNHDYWVDENAVRESLKDSNIIDVSNQVYSIGKENAVLNIAGIDDIWAGKPNLDLVIEKMPSEGVGILLVHEPDFADISSNTNRFDLELSGHSHGGQIYLPFQGAPLLPPYGKKYPKGFYQVDNMIQYTNRGVGMVSPYVRFNCRPEITVFTINNK